MTSESYILFGLVLKFSAHCLLFNQKNNLLHLYNLIDWLQAEHQLAVNIDVLAARLSEAEAQGDRLRDEAQQMRQQCLTLQEKLKEAEEMRSEAERRLEKVRQ